jgi:hypothetical protein
MSTASRVCVIVAGLGMAHLACGGRTPSAPTPVMPKASGAAGAGTATAASAVVPAAFQAEFAKLPPVWQQRFLRLRPGMQKQILALPQERIERLVRLANALADKGQTGALNDPPDAVFRTTPAARPDGSIRGAAPFEVTFNMCPTRDPDPGDALKYLYDFEGTGAFERGACRMSHVYDPGQPREYQATICVSDRQPDPGHDLCKTFTVDVLDTVPARCRTVTQGDGAMPATMAPAPQLFFTGFFDIAAQQGVKATVVTAGTPAAGTYSGLLGANYFLCGPVSGGRTVYSLFDATGAYVAGIDQSYDPGPAPQDFAGCYDIVAGSNYGMPAASIGWHTEVCDPGRF